MKHSRLFLLLASSALVLAGGAAHAQRGGHHGGDREGHGMHRGMMMLRAADANGDNSITREEVSQLQAEMFAWMDRNGDGYLDEADQSPVRQRLRARMEAAGEDAPRRHRRGGPDGGRHMMADADEDGRISRDEFLSRDNRMFEHLDMDENGVIEPAELDAAVERRQDRRHWWRD